MISVICPPQMESLCRCVSVSSSNIFHMARLSQCRLLSLILLQETRFRLCPTPRKYFFFRLVAVTDPGASLANVDTTHVQHVDATRQQCGNVASVWRGRGNRAAVTNRCGSSRRHLALVVLRLRNGRL